MFQIVEEYDSFDGSIKDAITRFLKSNPNYKVVQLQMSMGKHGIYALVIYEYKGTNNGN